MANKAEEDPGAVFKYEEVEVRKVDIVGGPATGDKFMVIRNDESGKPTRRAMTKRAVQVLSDDSPESKSVPVVARQEIVDAAIEEKSDTPAPVIEEQQNRVMPSVHEGEAQLPVERTEENPENISEETQMDVKKLNESVDRLSSLVERMTGTFADVLGAETPEGVPKAEATPEPEEAPKAEATPEPEEAPKAEETPAPEAAPQEAPVASEPVVDVPAPVVAETPQEAPVAAPVAADPAPASDITEAVAGLANVVERMGEVFGENLKALGAQVEGMATRVNKVERSVLSGGNSDQDDTEGPVERSTQPKSGLFSNLFHG